MFDKILIGMVINFVLRQLDKFTHAIDWAKVKADLEPRIRDLVPGRFFDDEAVAACNRVIDLVAAALASQADIDAILHLLAAQDWAGAFAKLRDLVLHVWSPSTAREHSLRKGLEAVG